MVDPIIELHPWLALPSGRDVLALEQAELDRLVSDIFGFHALQLGLPEVDALRANRMPHRWLALDGAYEGWMADAGNESCHLRCDFESLPFPSHSLDLVVLPHALELAVDPHHTLREVARVLVPEGKVVMAVFNPLSLWGLWQRVGQWGLKSALVLPQGEFVGQHRLKDWLRLLDFEIESVTFASYRPLLKEEVWWRRFAWMDRVGRALWPQMGAVHFVVAVKRVRGMRLVGRVKAKPYAKTRAPAVAANRSSSD